MAQIRKLKNGNNTIFPITDASAVQYHNKYLSEMIGGGYIVPHP